MIQIVEIIQYFVKAVIIQVYQGVIFFIKTPSLTVNNYKEKNYAISCKSRSPNERFGGQTF